MFTFGLPSPQSNVNLGQEIVKMNKQAHELEKKFGTGSTLRRFTKQQKKDAKKEYTALIEEVKKLVGEFGAHKFEAHKKAYDYNLMQEIKTLQTGLEKIARYCRVVPEKETIAQRITRAIIDFFHPKVIVTTACKNEVLEKAIQSIAWNSLSEDIQPYCTYDMPFTTDSFEEEGEWYIEKRDEQKKEIKICKKTAQKEEYITFVITVEKEGRVQVRQKTKRSGVFLQKTETNSYSSWQEIQKKFQLFDKSNISRLFEQKKQFLGSVYQEKPLDKDKNATNTWYIAPEVQSGALSTNFVLHLLDATYAFKINKNYKILFKNELFSSVSALVTHCVGNSRKENIAVKSLYDYETESLQRLKKNIRQQHIELASITKTLQWLNVDEAYVVLKEKDTESRYTLFSIKEGRATQETLWLDEKKNVFIYTSGRKKGRVALVSNIEKAVEATQRLVTQKIQLKLRYVENASFDAIKKKLEHVQKYPHYSRTPCYIIWSDGSSQPDFFVSVRNEGNTISTYPIQCDIWNVM